MATGFKQAFAEKEFVVRMDLAGLRREDVKIILSEGCLNISGVRQDRIPKGRKHFHKMEITVGPFERRIPVPRGWEVGDVKACYVDGVLQVVLEKSTRKEHGILHVKVE